jgi:hypothetical protein
MKQTGCHLKPSSSMHMHGITCRRDSALHCYGQWSQSTGNGHFQHLAEQNHLNRSKQKCVQLIMSMGPPSRPKLILIGHGVASPHMGEAVDLRSFSRDLSGKRTADNERSSPTYYTSIDAVSTKEVPFGGPIDKSHPMGSYPQNPSIWGRQWGFSA